MEHLKQYDTNGDGLIENGGFPDQTYDDWIATGESAYTGSLYLAALKATARMADKLGEAETAKEYDALEQRAADAYVKNLWTGTYFRYAVQGQDTEAVMAEQLAGQWYAGLTGLGDLVPKADARLRAAQGVRHQRAQVCQGRDGRRQRHRRRMAICCTATTRSKRCGPGPPSPWPAT